MKKQKVIKIVQIAARMYQVQNIVKFGMQKYARNIIAKNGLQ
jgi:hypothetical protein